MSFLGQLISWLYVSDVECFHDLVYDSVQVLLTREQNIHGKVSTKIGCLLYSALPLECRVRLDYASQVLLDQLFVFRF